MAARRWTWMIGGAVLLMGSAACCVGALPVGLVASVTLRETLEREEAAPRFGRFVDGGDVEVFVWEHGPKDGPVVVFLPGTSAWSGTYRDLVIDLGEAGYRCVAIDLPPFGFSERSDPPAYAAPDQARRVVSVLKELGLDQVVLLGHSFGGGATLETAMQAPDRTRGLVLLDVALSIGVESSGSPLVSGALAVPGLPEAVVAATFTNPAFYPTGVRSMIADPADATQVAIDRYTQPMSQVGTTAAVAAWVPELLAPREIPRTRDPALYARLDVPALVVWGADDTVTPLDQGQELVELLPQGELVVLDGVGHIPHLEDREGTFQAVEAFLKGLP